jgi:hypothetical protein
MTGHQAPKLALQLAPTLTVSLEVRRVVEQAFSDAGAAFEWLPTPGDPTLDDAARWGGIERIAQPSLDVIVSASSDMDHVELVASARKQLAIALGRIRRAVPELPISIRARTPRGECRFPFRPSAFPESIAEALDRIQDADVASGVVGWDEELAQWVRI